MNRIPAKCLPAALAAAALFLAGCNLFGNSPDPFIPKPDALNPEADAFSQTAVRNYFWKENLRRAGKDSLLGQISLQLVHSGDTLLDGVSRPRVEFAGSSAANPAPAAAFARLGFHPGRLLFDDAKVPDPGPGLPFPAAPAVGRRLDTADGDLRFVRELRGVETVRLSGKRHECWAFAESTFWGGQLLGAGATWMGRTGLVLHRSEWPGFAPSAASAGTLFREITAP